MARSDVNPSSGSGRCSPAPPTHPRTGRWRRCRRPRQGLLSDIRNTTPPEIPHTLDNDTCPPSDVWKDSVFAIVLDTGHVNWVRQRPGVDIFTAAGLTSRR